MNVAQALRVREVARGTTRYVNGANTTLEKLAEARDQEDFAAIDQLQKNLAFHLPGTSCTRCSGAT